LNIETSSSIRSLSESFWFSSRSSSRSFPLDLQETNVYRFPFEKSLLQEGRNLDVV